MSEAAETPKPQPSPEAPQPGAEKAPPKPVPYVALPQQLHVDLVGYMRSRPYDEVHQIVAAIEANALRLSVTPAGNE